MDDESPTKMMGILRKEYVGKAIFLYKFLGVMVVLLIISIGYVMVFDLVRIPLILWAALAFLSIISTIVYAEYAAARRMVEKIDGFYMRTRFECDFGKVFSSITHKGHINPPTEVGGLSPDETTRKE